MEYRNVKNKRIISPSIYAADFMNFGNEIIKIQKLGGDWIHIDVMDGHFVNPINFGQKIVSKIKSISNLPLDVHLMVDNPSDYLDSFIAAGADLLTFHYEAEDNCSQLLRDIQKAGVRAGLAISPSTPSQPLYPVLKHCDLVLVMTINPGTTGQTLRKDSLKKVEELRIFRNDHDLEFLISIDGGVNKDNHKMVQEADPDIIVIGSAFFQSNDPSETVQLFKT